MTLHLVTPPTDEIISLDEAKRHLRVDYAEDDDLIATYIAAAISQVDPASGGSLGCALRPQTWELRIGAFPFGGHSLDKGFYSDHPWAAEARRWHRHSTIVLPYPPLISIVSLKYDNADGAEQTLVESADFRVLGKPVPGNTSVGKASLDLLTGGSWPSALFNQESVRIRFTCGHRPKDLNAVPPIPNDELPAAIRVWLLQQIGKFYDNRSSVIIGATVQPMPDVNSLIDTYRVY